jgi:NADH-quinone oxidoreductase subunit G
MSAQPIAGSAPDHVNIEIDGHALQVPKGSMIIQAADKIGISIPRFCYHHKLPIAANCRQCLVEVEMGGKPIPKPQPACATPVAEGMKVHTRSEKALHWQRDVMEFLLINHPLDCPICDQGGECELQDVSLGYGRSISRYTERKRVVADEDLGPLVATEMTRCIQCTRCVRFMGEIAGTYELGGMSRGEHLEIGTYIGKSIYSELSGNIIDVCPVGALTNKVYRFQARAWELIARASIGYHDALGSNLWLHTRRGEVLRTVPRDNEAINECWLSDRDRYSHQGLYAADRARQPLVKRDGAWIATDWDDALGIAVERLRSVAGSDIGVLVQPATSCEEGALLARLVQGLGCANLDHRLRTLDFADAPVAQPWACSVDALQTMDAALLIDCDLRSELPLVNHRLREASKRGAKVFAVATQRHETHFALSEQFIAAPGALPSALAQLARAVSELEGAPAVPEALRALLAEAGVSESMRTAAHALRAANAATVLLGLQAHRHAQASWLRALAQYIAAATGAAYNVVPDGANALGLARVGVLPGHDGLAPDAMLAQPRKLYVLYGAEVPEDFAEGGKALAALRAADCVIAFSAYASERMHELADVILPIGLTPEIDATLINLAGTAQLLAAGAKSPGEARAGWKALRALGGLLGLPGFEFTELAELRAGLAPLLSRQVALGSGLAPAASQAPEAGLQRIAGVPIYRGDAVLRRATALQEHPLTQPAHAVLNPEDALALGLHGSAQLSIAGISLPVRMDAAIARGAVRIDATYPETDALPPHGAALHITKA